jgi:hypothetical protein
MLEILQFYVSGFWIWLGITIGLTIIVKGIAIVLISISSRGNVKGDFE